jgi:uncharacterized protein (DUF1810 family)
MAKEGSETFEAFVSAQSVNHEVDFDAVHHEPNRMCWFYPALGRAVDAQRRGHGLLGSFDEVRAYLSHEVLGPTLIGFVVECLAKYRGCDLNVVFGSDKTRFHECMSTFAAVSHPQSVFDQALQEWFGGRRVEYVTRRLSEEMRRTWALQRNRLTAGMC